MVPSGLLLGTGVTRLHAEPFARIITEEDEATHLTLCHSDRWVAVGLRAWKARRPSADCLLVQLKQVIFCSQQFFLRCPWQQQSGELSDSAGEAKVHVCDS